MRDTWDSLVKFFTSLHLTVGLLAVSALLVFLATIDQVHLGIWAVQEKWFRSFIVLQNVNGFPVPVFPGGYFVGGLLLINLVAAHAKRFSMTWKKAGIQLVHFGLILLLLGELFTGLFQEEYQMRLDEGQTKNYSEAWRENELAVVDATSPDEDIVTAIPEKHVARRSAEIQTPSLPFRIVVRAYYPNAVLAMKDNVPEGQRPVENISTVGLGPRLALMPLPITYKHDERNEPAALVELIGREGSIGTFLVSTRIPRVAPPDRFTYADREWTISFRHTRTYKPYSLTLLDFTHDRYAGTNIPKNFSSRVKLTTPDGVNDREVLIFMNNPLRYDGLTFYQAGFDNNDQTTILQVVRNPSWLIPYLSCLLMAVGLFWQFGWHLVLFTARRGRDGKTDAKVDLPAPVVALGLIISMRVLAGLIGLWVTGTTEGTLAAVGLGVLIVEFAACAAIYVGLATRGAWVRPLLTAYAFFSVLLLAGVVAYGFLGNNIYDAILRWVVIGVHALTSAALLAILRAFNKPEINAYLAARRASAA